MAKIKLQITSMREQYNKLKRKVNPLLKEDFKYGGASAKSYKLLKEQVRTMKQMLKGYAKYGKNMQSHNYKLNYYRVLKDVDEDVANRIRSMSSERFKEFYDRAVKNNYDSEIFDFNDFYFKNDEAQQEETINVINEYLDEFYGYNE